MIKVFSVLDYSSFESTIDIFLQLRGLAFIVLTNVLNNTLRNLNDHWDSFFQVKNIHFKDVEKNMVDYIENNTKQITKNKDALTIFKDEANINADYFDVRKLDTLLEFIKELFYVASRSDDVQKDNFITGGVEFTNFINKLESIIKYFTLDLALQLLDTYYDMFQKIKQENPADYKMIYDSFEEDNEMEKVEITRFLSLNLFVKLDFFFVDKINLMDLDTILDVIYKFAKCNFRQNSIINYAYTIISESFKIMDMSYKDLNNLDSVKHLEIFTIKQILYLTWS